MDFIPSLVKTSRPVTTSRNAYYVPDNPVWVRAIFTSPQPPNRSIPCRSPCVSRLSFFFCPLPSRLQTSWVRDGFSTGGTFPARHSDPLRATTGFLGPVGHYLSTPAFLLSSFVVRVCGRTRDWQVSRSPTMGRVFGLGDTPTQTCHLGYGRVGPLRSEDRRWSFPVVPSP